MSLLSEKERAVLELAHKHGALKVYAKDADEIARLLIEARSAATVLAHAYETDSRPPEFVLAQIRAWRAA